MKRENGMKVERVGDRLEFRFDGIGRTIALDVGKLTAEIREQAVFHGLKQKCVDAAAIMRNPATGASATAEEKAAAIAEMVGRLEGGEWNSKGDGGGTLLSAMVQAFPNKSREELKAVLEKLTEKQKRALRDSEKLKPFLPKGDGAKGDELLEGLMGEDGTVNGDDK